MPGETQNNQKSSFAMSTRSNILLIMRFTNITVWFPSESESNNFIPVTINAVSKKDFWEQVKRYENQYNVKLSSIDERDIDHKWFNQ